jgi:hypothetical protein
MLIGFDFAWQGRSGANEAHGSGEDVEELR